MSKERKAPKELYTDSATYISLLDDFTISINSCYGPLDYIERPELEALYEALKELFGESEDVKV